MTSKYEIKAGLEDIDAFDVVGVSVITDNKKGTDDINALWQRFFEESIGTKITNKVDNNIYAVYSDYEGDNEAPYRLTIGYKFTGDNAVPEGLHHVKVDAQAYAALAAQGPQPQTLIETWTAIWESDMDRSFTTDFEFYGPRFFEDGVHEVLVYIGLKN